MLEQAIIDAEQLKETARKTAEENIVEKYQDEIKQAVEKILEQEEASPINALEVDQGGNVEMVEELPAAQIAPTDETVTLDLDKLEELMAEEELDPSDMLQREEVAEELDAITEDNEDIEIELTEELEEDTLDEEIEIDEAAIRAAIAEMLEEDEGTLEEDSEELNEDFFSDSDEEEAAEGKQSAVGADDKALEEEEKPDFLDLDKDGDKEEPMKKAAKDKEKKKVKEGAEEEAQLVMAAKDMVDKVTGWMEDTASMQTETILELGDAIRDEEGSEKSESFINAVKPALESLYTSLEATREALTGGVAVLTGENAPDTMGADAEEPAMEPTTDADADMPDQSDDFAASEPASGGEEPADREKREHIIRLSRRLAETLSKKKA